jgi:hypothetical protein
MSIEVDGIGSLVSRLGDIPDDVADELRPTLRRIGSDLHRKSLTVAPFLEGDLRAAGFADPIGGGHTPGVEVGYNGPRDYLAVQHEGGWRNLIAWGREMGPTRIENYTTPGTGPKFLERPWLENKGRYSEALQDAARRGLRRG